MIPFELGENQPGNRDFTKEKNARVLIDLLQVNTHYRFVTWQGQWKTVTQMYAKRYGIRWDHLYVFGAPKKMMGDAEQKRHHWRDRQWAIPGNGNRRVQVFSNKKLVWEGTL